MARKLTSSGSCPVCSRQVLRKHDTDRKKTFYAMKSITVDRVNNEMVGHCSNCKTELEMPVMIVPRKIKKIKNV